MFEAVGGLAVALVVLGLPLSLIEKRWPAVAGQPRWREDSRTDLLYWFFTPLVTKSLTAVAVGAVLVAAAILAGVPLAKEPLEGFFRPSGVIASQPLWLQGIEFLVLADLIAYWVHRWMHRPGLWPFHAVHHSSVQLDWLSAVRVHPMNDVLARVAQSVPLVLLGFDPRALAAYLPLLSFYSVFVHANVPWDFGPLRWIITTPAFHRWHHAANDVGVGRNFAELFPVFDLIFGTFHLPRGRQPSSFGAPDAVVPDGLVAQLRYPFKARG